MSTTGVRSCLQTPPPLPSEAVLGDAAHVRSLSLRPLTRVRICMAIRFLSLGYRICPFRIYENPIGQLASPPFRMALIGLLARFLGFGATLNQTMRR